MCHLKTHDAISTGSMGAALTRFVTSMSHIQSLWMWHNFVRPLRLAVFVSLLETGLAEWRPIPAITSPLARSSS